MLSETARACASTACFSADARARSEGRLTLATSRKFCSRSPHRHPPQHKSQRSLAVRGQSSMSATPTTEDAKCWTNDFTGRLLTPISKQVWGAERPFGFLGIDVGGRGAVIQLSDGSLWTQSPVELTPELQKQLDAIGPVKHIVSPNYEHTKFAQQWKDAYPDATLYGCPGLPDKKPDVAYDTDIGVNDAVPDSWLGEIEATHLDYERVPVLGQSFFNEVVFLHKPSRTLIVTDLWWNYPSESPAGTKLWKQGMDRIYGPFYNRYMKGDRGKYDAAIERIFGWDWEAMVPCHGTVVTSGGKEVLRKHLDEPAPRLISK